LFAFRFRSLDLHLVSFWDPVDVLFESRKIHYSYSGFLPDQFKRDAFRLKALRPVADDVPVLSQAQPSQARPGQAQPSQAKPSQAKPNQAKQSQGQAKPSQARPSQAKPGQARPSQVKPSNAKPSQARPSQSPERSR